MNRSASLLRSIPFFALIVLALASTVLGGWIVTDRIATMNAGLDDGSATTSLVYGGQSWVVVGAALIGAGVIGLITALALAVVARLVRPAEDAVVIVAEDAASESPFADADEVLPSEDVAVDPAAETEASVDDAPLRRERVGSATQD